MIQRHGRPEGSGSGLRLRVQVRAPDLTPERLSTDELVELLLRGGARLLVRQDHGVFLAACRHLIFLRRAPVVTRAELRDALRAAGIGPGRFDMLLAELRGSGGVSHQASPESAPSRRVATGQHSG